MAASEVSGIELSTLNHAYIEPRPWRACLWLGIVYKGDSLLLFGEGEVWESF